MSLRQVKDKEKVQEATIINVLRLLLINEQQPHKIYLLVRALLQFEPGN
jgi:hypothetical protein